MTQEETIDKKKVTLTMAGIFSAAAAFAAATFVVAGYADTIKQHSQDISELKSEFKEYQQAVIEASVRIKSIDSSLTTIRQDIRDIKLVRQ